MKLNLGCGDQVLDGWVNVDYALGARLMKFPFFRALNKRVGFFSLDWDERVYIHDLTTEFPWADASIDVVYSSHTLEHFSKKDGRRFLTECHRVLRNDGILRIVVPDLRHDVTEYIEGRIPADDFVEQLGVLHVGNNSRIKARLAPLLQFPHKCMYDGPRLLEIINGIGFQASARTAFDSDIKDILRLELADRTVNAAIVEGRKQ